MACIHVTLDSLLDTRLGTLIYLDEQEAARVFDCGYYQRTSDDWSALGLNINQSEYQRVYENRSEGGHILSLSKITNAVALVVHMADELEEQAKTTPFNDKTRIEVNTYPYLFSAELCDTFARALGIYFPDSVEITTTRVSTKELTPSHIDEYYDMFVIYDFNEWLQEHYEKLRARPIPSTLALAPALYHNQIPDDEELKDEQGNTICPFAALEYVLTPMLSLSLADVRYFSLIEP